MRCPDCRTFNIASAKFCNSCGVALSALPALPSQGATTSKKKSPILVGGIGLGLLGIVVAIGLLIYPKPEPNPPFGRAVSPPAAPNSSTPPKASSFEINSFKTPLENVTIKNWTWNKDGFGTVMMAEFTIHNDNDFAVKDIGIHCKLSGNSGTALDTADQTIYEAIKAHGTRTFPEVNMGFVPPQATKAGCKIREVEEQ